MSAGIDQFTESLRIKLNKMQSQLEEIKSDISSVEKEGKGIIQTKLKEAKLGVQIMKKDIRSAEAKTRNWLNAKEKSGTAVVKSWIANADKNKLERHAKVAEENAVAAMSLAEGKMADAVFAKYEALEARMAADTAFASKH